MHTIDNLDFVNHERFASDTKDYELFKADLRVDNPAIIETNYISKQVEVNSLQPTVPSLISLFEADQKSTWAHFEAPANFFTTRSINGYVVSKLGSPSAQEADIEKLEKKLHAISNKLREAYQNPATFSDQEIAELKNLKKQGLRLLRTLYKGILDTHQMVDFVHGRMLQYLQG
jgi:hypothetical protein